MTMVQSPSHIKALGPHGLGFLDSFCPCSKSPARGRCWIGKECCDFTLMAIGSVSIGTALWISFVGCKSVYVMCVCVCVVSCRCIASVCKYCTSEYINKFNQMQEDVVQLAVRRNRTYRGNDDYTVVAVFKQLRRNNSQTNIKMPKDTPSMQKASYGNSEWILSCLTLDLPIFQFRLQFKGWLPVVEHTCWRKAVINFKLTGAEREIFLLDHLISKFVIGQTGIRHGILPCQK